MSKDWECDLDNCVFQQIYGGDANLACDTECSLSSKGEYHDKLSWYKERFPEFFKQKEND